MEFITFLTWYVFQFIIGIIGLPFANYFFKDWKDKGYPFAKVIGLFVCAFPLWFFSSLKIIPFNSFSSYFFFLSAFAVAIIVIKKQNIKINKHMILEEFMFFIVLLTWLFIRSTNPRVEGTEKLMNIAFMNSIDRTNYFPPLDPWQSGETINYYYFGHYFIVYFAKITSIPINFAYNFALITIISQFFVSIFSISINLYKVKANKFIVAFVGILISFFVTFGGNLHYSYTYFIDLFNPQKFSYFFPNATRIISFTINEFPSYSIVLGDVHPHYMSLPFFTLALALSIASIKIPINSQKKIYFNLIISPIIIALYAINSWDLITILTLFTIIHGVQILANKEGLNTFSNIFNYLMNEKATDIKIKKHLNELLDMIKTFLIVQFSLLISGMSLLVPYFLNFRPPVGGVGFVPTTRDWTREVITSDLESWFLIWGAFLFVIFMFSALLVSKRILVSKDNNFKWVILIIILSFLLIIGVEFIFLKDIFFETNRPYFRTNTVFKFYYHGWILMGIASGFMIMHIFNNYKPKFNIEKTISVGLVLFMMFLSNIYILKAVDDFYFGMKYSRSMDGNQYIKETYPQDYLAINWIKTNIKGQPVIAEAVGEAYTYYARISSNTGLVTVMGWPTHEWQWRGSPDIPFERSNDIKSLYESKTSNDAKKIINKYSIEYIYIGTLEFQKYSQLNLEILISLGEKVYESEGNYIIKVKK